MQAEEIEKLVQDYIENNTYGKTDKLTQETLIFKEGILDSMGILMLITFLEKTFNIDTKDIDLIDENFESIVAIRNYILKKLSQKACLA